MRFNSIRLKLFLSVVMLVILFISLSLFLNNSFFKSYYLKSKQKQLQNIADEIKEDYQISPDGVLVDFEILEKNRGLHITILNEYMEIIYDSYDNRNLSLSPSSRDNHPDLPPPENRQPDQQLRNLQPGEYRFTERIEPKLQNHFIDFATFLNSNDILILSVAVALIDESVMISNQFLLYAGAVILIVGILFSFFFSTRFTKPIIELDNIAKNMAQLNFDTKYESLRKDELGELGSSINSLSDQLNSSITKLRESNDQLQIELNKEREMDKMRKEFVSSVSHELKTPISLIQGYSEGLIDNVVSDEKSRKFYAEVIVDEAKKMDRHVTDLLDLNRLESGLHKLDLRTLDITELVESIITKYKKEFDERAITCVFNCKKSYLVKADTIRIEQVIQNYINNAIDYLDNKKMIDITITETEQFIRLNIFNSGSNISQENRSSIWKSYFKADKARTRSKGGTGLGLSIVKTIIEKHNGFYGVENRETGVVFWFELKK